jgi:hypothetical protein
MSDEILKVQRPEPWPAPPADVHSIDLKAPRVVAIEDRGKQYLLTVGRILKKQWLKYFEGILSTSENEKGATVNQYDSSTARLELIESALIDAQGYPLPEGKSAITQLPGWQALLPLSHRLGAANALVAVTRSEAADDAPIALGRESVYLDAVWSADATGVMRKFSNLRHDFKTPTAEQQRRLARDNGRSRVVGGSRKGTTVWLGAQATMAELYDELIVAVEGYSVDGAALEQNIPEWMDTFHKVAAIDVLFAPAAPKVEEDVD